MTVNSASPLAATIPETVYMFFQMTFAIITPALIAGALADRMKFSAFMWFMALWLLLVYCPVAHGYGAAAFWARWARWISPAARWCISMPAPRPWLRA
jgi:ammonia channel protein AmtB